MATSLSQQKSSLFLLSGIAMAICLFMFGTATEAFAQNSSSNYVPSGRVEDSGRGGLVQCGNKVNDPCTVEDIFNVFIIATNLLIGLVGLITIYAVFSAGFTMVTSSGNTEKTTAGKKQLTNALIGMLLVLLAFMLVNVIIYGLAGAKTGRDIFNPLDYIGLTSGSSPAPAPASNAPPANGP